MPRASSRILGLLLISAALLSPLVIGCQRQGEGERCSTLNKDSDCQDGLVCTDSSGLREGADEVDRCCPEPGEPISDNRCSRRTGTGDGDGLGGVGGMSGDGDGDDLSGFGDGCGYTSDCDPGLVCGPGGVCQNECNRDRDCPEGEVCSEEKTCEAAN